MPSFSTALEETLHRTIGHANAHHHEYATLEHLLLALIDDADAAAVMSGCNVDLAKLRGVIDAYIETDLKSLIEPQSEEAKPTAGFQRVIQRAVIHVQSSGRDEVTGANVLVSIFSERDSHACFFLQEQEMTRYDAVNYMAHNLQKKRADKTSHILDFSNEVSESNKSDRRKSEEVSFAKNVGQRADRPFIFISYSRDDLAIARAVCELLTAQGIRVWWDQDIPPGQPWRSAIKERLTAAAAVLVIWSEQAVRSGPVLEEATLAQQYRKLVPVRVDRSEVPYGFLETQWLNLDGWPDIEHPNEIRRLLAALHDKLSPPQAAQIKLRLVGASPTAAKVVSGKISVVDAPPNTFPLIDDKADLRARLRGQRKLCTHLKSEFAPGKCNLPQAILTSVSRYDEAIQDDDLSWYELEDAAASIRHCLKEYSDVPWPGTTSPDLCQLLTRHAELEPLLRPKQIVPDDAKPVPPIVDMSKATPAALSDIVNALQEVVEEPGTKEVLEPTAEKAVEHYSKIIETAIEDKDTSPGGLKRKYWDLSRGVSGLAGVLGSLSSILKAGTELAKLASPLAQAVLQKLDFILNMILKLF